MKRIVEFPLESGGSIFAEVDEPASTDDRIGLRDDITQQAQHTLESALESVKPITNAIMSKIRSLNEPADEVQVKFGVKMSAELGAVIASGNGEVNYEITLKWKRESKDDSSN